MILPIPFYTLTWMETWEITPAMPLLTLSLHIITFTFFILTMVTEPGIIPKKDIQLRCGTNFYLEEL